ncbi:tyrosine-tRNA ligase [Cokeromyces recurvatus]|uniref:tyrosine-tRNA ligase n=1 Tax=Cokeromyces recurvatus TaxID=90255 RepID=UPI002220AC83|nr:tyrosine-tRNA ligase [Cokeromyces recurvatus]XP_051380201.1 tyrosine-tRNA ligase [Cokeromyces recurvatus]KAI7899070.1 tyrosine-tRNA ligase [Cokeromyces recurvatus]KAI7900216.1 tyrosine-tRNA ligase [Cokeromyces recurvatus]
MNIFRQSQKLNWTHVLKINTCFISTYSNVVKDMTQRGLVSNITSPEIIEKTNKPTTIYCGVDPTAKSLHLGNLVTLMGLLHFHIRGHQTIALVGGATGSIGDPSGRKSERVPLSQDILRENVAGIERQIHRFFKNGASYANRRGFNDSTLDTREPKVLNNFDWFSNMSALDFLSSIGRYARVNSMLAKESVKSRLETTQGISFTEFSYQLLQAYDFWYLHHHHDCRIQLGGNDQWGNITAGIDLIARKKKKKDDTESESESKVFGITIPLLLTSTGEKFGKSAGNAIWLDEYMTSVFDFYQFLMKTTDEDVGKYLSMFTLLKEEHVSEIMAEHQKYPEKRFAQKKLADETTELVHGIDGLRKAKTATQVLFGEDLSTLSGDQIIEAFKTDRNRFIKLDRSAVIGSSIDIIASVTNAAKSKSDAQKKIKAGGFYLNNQKITNVKHVIEENDLIDGKVLVLRTGKSSYYLIQII